MAKKKTETQESPQAEQAAKPEKREPQMVTPNGDKVTHAHIFKSNNSDTWFFTARINNEPLKPRPMDPADTDRWFKKETTVPQLMEKYYPTKLMEKVPEEVFRKPAVIDAPGGNLTVEKFNVYKEKNMDSPDYGKYKFYAQVGDLKMSAPASREDLNAYFDRTTTPAKLVEKNFGDRLGLPSHYQQYKLPEGIEEKNIRIAKNSATNQYEISGNFGKNGQTESKPITYADRQAFFASHSATKAQLGAKYLGDELLRFAGASQSQEQAQSKKHTQSR